MEKTKLVGLIQEAKISDELRAKLLGMVGEQEEVAPETLSNIRAELDRSAEGAIQDIVNLQVLNARDQFDADMTKVDQQVGAFNRELTQRADKADLTAARTTINQQ